MAGKKGREFERLLGLLAVGATHPLVTLDDWDRYLARRLNASGVGAWFVAALHQEWKEPSPPTALCALIQDEVEAAVRSQGAAWPAILGHILRVTGSAQWLAERNQIDVELVYITALFHDVAKLEQSHTGQSHEAIGAKRAQIRLQGELSSRQIEIVYHAIDIHPDRPAPSWRVARALHDADKLDKVGATGLLRRVSVGEDVDEAWDGLERMLDDADELPPLCLPAAGELRRQKLQTVARISALYDEVDVD